MYEGVGGAPGGGAPGAGPDAAGPAGDEGKKKKGSGDVIDAEFEESN
jgi:hypothetical protein